MAKNDPTKWDDSYFSKDALDRVDEFTTSRKRILNICVAGFWVIIGLSIIFLFNGFGKYRKYISIDKLYEASKINYENAVSIPDEDMLNEVREDFVSLSGYKESYDYISLIDNELVHMETYNEAKSCIAKKVYVRAFELLEGLLDYRDSRVLAIGLADDLYKEAEGSIAAKDYERARAQLSLIPEYLTDEYNKAQSLCAKLGDFKQNDQNDKTYKDAVELYNTGNYDSAQNLFIKLNGYSDSNKYLDNIGESYYSKAEACYNSKEYVDAYNILGKIDSLTEWSNAVKAQELRTKIKDEYTGYVKTEALNILYNKGYVPFTEFLESSTNALFTSNDASLLISAHQVVSLYDIAPFDEFEWKLSEDEPSFPVNKIMTVVDNERDIYDNKYDKAIIGGRYCDAYLADGKYSRLVGSLYVRKYEKSREDSKVEVYIKDKSGNVLYHGTMMTGDKNLYFSVDITGLDYVYIYFNGYDKVHGALYGGLANLAFIQ